MRGGFFFMDIWHVRGGNRLFGSCRVQGSKNASLPVLAASIVFPARSRIRNVPRLRDADAAVSILSHLGCSVGREENELYIDSGSVADADIPRELMAEMRSSVIFMGALLARCGEARLSLPGAGAEREHDAQNEQDCKEFLHEKFFLSNDDIFPRQQA